MNLVDKIYIKNPDFVAREVADEFILVPIRKNLKSSNSIYVLNQTGRTFWCSLDGKKPLSNILRDLSNEFEVTEEQLEKDFLLIMEDLLSIQAIEEVFPARNG